MLNVDVEFSLTEDGAWAELNDSKFKIVHISSLKFQRTLARLQQPHKRKIEAGTIDPQLSKDLLCRAMADSLILDWENVVNSKGEMVEYSADICYNTLKKNPEFREFVIDFSSNLENYRSQDIDDMGKN